MSTTKSESINELAAALSKAQGQMTAAKMDSINPFLKNKYADLGSVIQAARKPLSDNGLSFTQHPTIEAGQVSVSTTLMHASGQWIESVITLPLGEGKGLSMAQAMGAVITYLRRYALSAILGIYADEDTDGNDSKPQAAKPAQSQPAQHAPVTGPIDQHAPIEAEPITQSHTGEAYDQMTIAELAGRHTHYTKLSRDANQPAEVMEQSKKTADYIEGLIKAKRAAK